MNYGFIYCMSNDSMPGLYKIGQTERAPSYRRRELSKSTSAPADFEILLFAEVEEPLQTERFVHERLAEYRLNASREFFKVPSLGEVYALFRGVSDLVCVTTAAEYEMHVERGDSV